MADTRHSPPTSPMRVQGQVPFSAKVVSLFPPEFFFLSLFPVLFPNTCFEFPLCFFLSPVCLVIVGVRSCMARPKQGEALVHQESHLGLRSRRDLHVARRVRRCLENMPGIGCPTLSTCQMRYEYLAGPLANLFVPKTNLVMVLRGTNHIFAILLGGTGVPRLVVFRMLGWEMQDDDFAESPESPCRDYM